MPPFLTGAGAPSRLGAGIRSTGSSLPIAFDSLEPICRNEIVNNKRRHLEKFTFPVLERALTKGSAFKIHRQRHRRRGVLLPLVIVLLHARIHLTDHAK